MDVLLSRRPDGSIKLQIYRKPTHTDAYLMFDSHHPVQHKFSVIRTLLGRNHEIVTEEADRVDEEAHVIAALRNCKYPEWAISKIKADIAKKQAEPPAAKTRKKKTDGEKKNKGMVVLPYVQGVTERVQRAMRKYDIETPVRPLNTLRRALVHPKDKIETNDKCGTVYKIPCHNCDKVYIGESARKLGTRLKEHQADCRKVEAATRRTRGTTETAPEPTSSGTADHVRDDNHVINFEGAEVIDRDGKKLSRWIREAIHIRGHAPNTMNRDEGQYNLPHVWDQVIEPKPTPRNAPPPAARARR